MRPLSRSPPFTAATTVSLDATIDTTGLSAGPHSVVVQASDSLGNSASTTSPCTTGPCSLVIDQIAPALTGASWQYLNQTPPPLRLTARFADTGTGGSTITAMQGRIDAGNAFDFVPSSGAWNQVVATGYGDVPASTLALLTSGSHTLSVRGMDASGNWSGWQNVSPPLVVSNAAPTVNTASVSPSPTAGRTTVLTATATSSGANSINRAEYFIGTDPGLGNATLLNVTGTTSVTATATIDVTAIAEGPTVVSVRVRDSAGNWSPIRNVNLRVSHPLYFSTVGNTNPPGVTGTADDADVIRWGGPTPGTGTGYSRYWDMRGGAGGNSVPANANVDGLQVISSTKFCVSFNNGSITITGLGTVRDKDIVCYDSSQPAASRWSLKFNGTARGLTSNQYGIDGFHFLNFGLPSEQLYFTLNNSRNPVTGSTTTGDDSNIYVVGATGSSYSIAWNAQNHGVPAAANLTGMSMVDLYHIFLSFNADVDLPDVGGVTGQDVMYYNAGVYSVYFNGGANGLAADPNLTPDALDVP